MKKIINKIKAGEELEHDLEYWLTKTDEEKISSVQILREQYIVFFNKQKVYNESRKRLRRVYRVTEQTRS
jgi:hypothetical protein